MNKKNLFFSLALIFALGCSEFGDNSKSNSGATPPAQPDSSFNDENPFDPETDPVPVPEGSTASETEVFTEKKMLMNIGLNVIQPAVKQFRLQSEMLATKTAAYCQALTESENAETEEKAAQEQWKDAMLAYHRVDAAPVGPLSDNSAEMADQIYAWPYINLCGIDIQVEKLARTGQSDSGLMTSVKGLGALEYLLFESKLGTQCNPNNASLKPVHDWALKSEKEKKKDRCAFAQALSQDVLKKSQELEKRWDSKRGNFTKTLVDGTRYKSLKEAINDLSNSMFSIEKVKDDRLGKPLGLHKDCLDESGKCLELVEHAWSGISLEAIEAQIRGFQNVFWGGNQSSSKAFGFDDYLAQMKRQDVAENMTQNLNRIVSSLRETKSQGSLLEQVQKMNSADCKASTSSDRKVKVCALFHDVRLVTTKLKTEFLMALSLQAPPTYQGDND